MAKTTLGGTDDSKAGKNKFHKTHPKRTTPGNRDSLADKYPQPNELGFGTPLVLIYDRSGRLILDLIPVGQGYYEVALVSFTYDFREKEEDECIIVMSASSVSLMDNLKFYQGQTIAVSWGYMDGNLRIPLRLVVVDTKEKYTDNGYEFTIVASDNLSHFSKAKSPLLNKLEASHAALVNFFKGGAQDVEGTLSQLQLLKKMNWGFFDEEFWPDAVIIRSGEVKTTGKLQSATSPNLKDYMQQLQEEFLLPKLDQGSGTLDNSEEPDPLLAGLSGVYAYKGSELEKSGNEGTLAAKGLTDTLHPDNLEQIAIGRVVYKTPGIRVTVTGKNAQSLAQNACDKVAPYPMQVVGRDGKMVTYNKDRAIRTKPIKTYIWKQENGNLLEFTYDTNAKYSDDNSVLREFAVDPKTGAITQKDHINSVKKVVDTYGPVEDEQQRYLRMVENNVENVVLNDPDPSKALNDLKNTEPFNRASAYDKDGHLILIARGEDILDQTPSYLEMRGTSGINVIERDNLAAYHPVVAIVNPFLEDLKQSTENEIAALRRGEQERTKANAKILGDPQMVSGVNVVFQGLAKRRCGTYFITTCTHTIGSEGYTTKLEMYWIGGISVGVNTVETQVSKGDITKKAKELKDTKVKMNPNYWEITKRGYYLRTDFVKGTLELRCERVDKDWNKKMPGMFYRLIYKDPTDPNAEPHVYIIRIPLTGDNTGDYPLEAFGYDALYDLVGCHDELKVRYGIRVQRLTSFDTNRDTDWWGTK